MADKLGMPAADIRFLDKRLTDAAEGFLSWLEKHPSSTVGNLYKAMVDYELPMYADLM